MALSYTSSAFVKARSSSVLKIIRTLFGADSDQPVRTYTQFAEDGAIHFMSPMVSAAMIFSEKNWRFEIVNDYMNIGLNQLFIVTILSN